MSQRTVGEFNHDFSGAITRDPDGFLRALGAMFNGGSQDRYVAEGLKRYGVKVTPTSHHSTGCEVLLKFESSDEVFHKANVR